MGGSLYNDRWTIIEKRIIGGNFVSSVFQFHFTFNLRFPFLSRHGTSLSLQVLSWENHLVYHPRISSLYHDHQNQSLLLHISMRNLNHIKLKVFLFSLQYPDRSDRWASRNTTELRRTEKRTENQIEAVKLLKQTVEKTTDWMENRATK